MVWYKRWFCCIYSDRPLCNCYLRNLPICTTTIIPSQIYIVINIPCKSILTCKDIPPSWCFTFLKMSMLNRNILLLIFASCENYEFEMNAEQPSLERLFCKAMKRCKKENSHPNTKKNNVQWSYKIYRSDI